VPVVRAAQVPVVPAPVARALMAQVPVVRAPVAQVLAAQVPVAQVPEEWAARVPAEWVGPEPSLVPIPRKSRHPGLDR
jgi:hypothetical protein